MILKLKNKYLLAVKKVLKEAEETGGIPKEIIITPIEAAGLIYEYMDLGEGLKFTFDDSTTKFKFLLKKDTLELEQLKELVDSWYHYKIKVEYIGGDSLIPLIVRPDKKTKKKIEKTMEQANQAQQH